MRDGSGCGAMLVAVGFRRCSLVPSCFASLLLRIFPMMRSNLLCTLLCIEYPSQTTEALTLMRLIYIFADDARWFGWVPHLVPTLLCIACVTKYSILTAHRPKYPKYRSSCVIKKLDALMHVTLHDEKSLVPIVGTQPEPN